MKKLPAVSVYIVTYLNSEERGGILKRTCEAALAQRYPDFEVVVSDNGGDYPAHKALSSLTDSRLKVFTNPSNAGFTGNINRCLKHCCHSIIKPICDDDLIHPDFLIHTVPFVDDETLVVVDVEKYKIGNDPIALETQVVDPPRGTLRSSGYDRVWKVPFSASCIPSATLFTRRLFEDLGGYDAGTITSDWDFFIEACLQRRVAHVEHTLCYVGVWSGSLTVEMEESPFFFPKEGLYTKFRVFHHHALPPSDRWALLWMLLREGGVQILRVVKHVNDPAYRTGFRDYCQCFFNLLCQNKCTAARSNRERVPLLPADCCRSTQSS